MTNQLLAEAETQELPELDEYSNMSATDIAHAIVSWPEGSEDQVRAIWALQRLIPKQHHNRAPLAERLDVDFAGVRGRADALLAIGSKAMIVDQESAEKVLETGKAMVTLERDVETLRKNLLKPYSLAVDMINAMAKAIVGPVKLAREGEDGKGGLRRMVTQWDDQERAKAEAARLAAEEEQRQREEAAEAARRRVEEAAEAGRGVVGAELQAAEAADEAERARIRAEAIRPPALRSNSATMSRSRVIRNAIEDEDQAFAAVRPLPGVGADFREWLQKTIDKITRTAGVEACAKGAVKFAGVKTTVELGSANVR